MVIYSTTNDIPVIWKLREWDFVKCWQKGILYIEERPKNSSSCVSVEKLLILRRDGILVSSPHLAPPFFRFAPPSPVDFSAVQEIYLFLLGIITGWEELWFEYLLCYNIMLLRKFFKNWKKSAQRKSWKPALDGAGRLHPSFPKNERTPLCYLIFPLLAKPSFSWKWK